MIDFKSDILKKFVQDYRINVIEPASLTKEQLKKFTTGFREVMECIKYSEDMHAMQQALAENDRFKNLDRKTSNVMRYCSKLKIDFEIDEEEFDMCKAFEDYKDLGKSEGLEEGIAIGKSEGREEGELKKGITTAISMIRDNLSDDKITLYTDLPLSSVQIIRQQLDNGIDDAKKIMQLL